MTTITSELRTPGSTVTADLESGKVTYHRKGQDSVLIAQCDPSSPAYRPFAAFWAQWFPENHKSMAYNRMVDELAEGTLVQDEDCPTLFLDKNEATVLESGNKDPVGYMLVMATRNGEMKPYNPDGFYVNAGYALISNPRIKFYITIGDFDGHNMPDGVALGMTIQAGCTPSFETSELAHSTKELFEMVPDFLKAHPTAEPARKETFLFPHELEDADSPF